MKTWRERIAEAKARGDWTAEDIAVFVNRGTCLAAETALNLGVEGVVERANRTMAAMINGGDRKVGVYDPFWAWSPLWEFGDHVAVNRGRADEIAEVERDLDRIEDLALRIKRVVAS